ncbi:MAG TPA: site-specific DNA-methyltransferase [Anaeromyxobacteraceae bacterium]|nr:site-specific DNA-methyltransferase [Anaeromyxobacteraceae bacterium]
METPRPYDLRLGDSVRCAEAMALLGSLPDASVPLIVADPPYGIGYHSNRHKGKNPHAPVARDWNFQIGGFLRECGRVLADGGALYLFTRWDVYPLWAPAVEPAGLKLRNCIAWVKNVHSSGDLAGDYGNRREEVMFCVKGRHVRRGHRWSNVWEFDRVPPTQALHPTQKPLPLVDRIVTAGSDPGDLVVDPFSGSGTTALSARGLGRQFLVGDVDPAMVRLTRRRLGWPVEGEPGEEPLTLRYSIEEPDPAAWGVHPEDVADLCAMLRENVAAADLFAGVPS